MSSATHSDRIETLSVEVWECCPSQGRAGIQPLNETNDVAWRLRLGGLNLPSDALGQTHRLRARFPLLNSTTNLRKHRTGIRANQSHHAGDDHKDDGQHDGVFRDVLPLGFLQEPVQMVVNGFPLGSVMSPSPEPSIEGIEP